MECYECRSLRMTVHVCSSVYYFFSVVLDCWCVLCCADASIASRHSTLEGYLVCPAVLRLELTYFCDLVDRTKCKEGSDKAKEGTLD